MLKPTRPLYLAQNLEDLSKLVTKQSYGKKLALLYRASDKLAQNVFDTNLELPADEEKIYILAMRYINLINIIRVQVQDERFFSTRFASTLRRVEEVKVEVWKSLSLRYDLNSTRLEHPMSSILSEGNEKLAKSKIVHDGDVYISPHQLYALMNEKDIKLLIMDARSSAEFDQCAIKFENMISIPDDAIRKGLSANTLQQKLKPSTLEVFKTRHEFDYIVLTDLDANKISYPTTKLHDLRVILVEWDPEQRYQTLPLVLEGGVRAMADCYPTLLTSPSSIFNQLFHQFDELMKDDIEYPDVQMLESPVAVLEPEDDDYVDDEVAGELAEVRKEEALHVDAQRLLRICEHQAQLEEKLLRYTEKRVETRRKLLAGSLSASDAQLTMAQIAKDTSQAESYRLELEERRRLLRNAFDAQSEDVSHLDCIFKDVGSLEKKRLMTYQRRKRAEQELERHGESPSSMAKLPVLPDRSTKPSAANALELELATLAAHFPTSGIVGQANIKNTCYMNALVQCLRFCPSVAYYLTMRTFTAGCRLTSAFSDLVKTLWTATRGPIRPTAFYAECCQLPARDYSTGEHEDIHEFFLNVTNAMHKELAEPLETTAGECTSYLADWHKHFKSRVSFVKRTFFYQLEATAGCTRCNARLVRYEYDNNVFLSVDGDQPRAIDVQREVDRLVRDAGATRYCSKCELAMSVTQRITFFPRVLVVNIMRYTYSVREQCVLRAANEAHFGLELVFGSARYALSAIACHSGNRDRGHYTACCYHPTAKRWIEYNDETCSPANIQDPAYRVRAFLLFYSLSPAYDGINRHFFQ